MKYNKGFTQTAIVLIVLGILVIGGGAYYFGKNSKDTVKEIKEADLLQEEKDDITSTPTQKIEETSENITTKTSLENIKTPLFIKSVYKKDGRWLADVDYVTKITPLEHMTRRINEGSCVLPGMTKNQMIEYAKNTVKKYVEQDNLLVVNCGYDWQGIWYSDGSTQSMFINTNPLIRSLPFSDKVEREGKVCGVSHISASTPEDIKYSVDLQNEGIKINQYSFDTYETKGYFEELVVIEKGEIKKFYGPDGCAG